ncbi:MAG: SNF2-related protein, partial [Acidimicrobiia bacterium]
MPSVPNSDRPNSRRPASARPDTDRPVLDGRLDGGQLWLLTDPDDLLRAPPLGELAEILGPGARPVHQSFWFAPTGFERRWAVAVDEAAALQALITTGWPVTPALGRLLELFVAVRRIVADGQVLPGPLPNFATAWIAAPERDSVQPLADALAAAQIEHPDADELCGYLIHTLSVAALGPVPAPLAGRRPSSAFTRWVDRVIARRAVNARLVLRLETDADGFVLVPCVEARRVTTVVTELGDLEPIAATLDVAVETLAALIDAEWAAARQAWPALREREPVRQELALDDVVKLVETAAPRLTAAGISMLLPARLGQRYTSRRRYRVKGQPASLDVANLILTGEVRVGDTTLSTSELDALLNARHDLISLEGRWIFLAEGERARIADFVRRFGATDAAAVLEAAADAEGEPDVEFELDIAPASWLNRALAGTWHPAPAERVPVPDAVEVPLRDYQRDGLDWLVWLERNGLGGILADDMGLGKTAMLLALTAHDHEGPTLVVAPTSVVGNWVREAERFTPSLRVAVHHGETRGDPVDTAGGADLVITTYGLLRRDERLANVKWHRVIVDEAQALKNADTATAKAARAITARNHIAATGTPVENHLGELWSIMSFVNPGLLSNRRVFAAQYRLGGAGDELADAERLEHLHRRIAAFVCRRTKTDPGIVDELPERIVVRDDCLLTHEQVTLYQATARAMLDEVADITETSRRRLHVFAGIARLKQICNHPASLVEGDGSELTGRSGKLERLVELIEEIVAEDEAVVVFSQYATFLRRVAPHLSQQLRLDVPVLHGGVARARRDEIVEEFDRGSGAGVLAVSLRAGGTGLNLVRANHVIHFDRWWNPAVEDQASDRVWRIGQTRGVVVHTLVCPGTIEERIAAIIESKRALAGSIITS